MVDTLKCSWSATARILKGLEEAFLAEIAGSLHEFALQDKNRDYNVKQGW